MIKQEMDDANIVFEETLAALRSKQNSNISDLGEHIDNLNKMKTKSEKDKANMERDLAEARG